jgi:hypothetical protein
MRSVHVTMDRQLLALFPTLEGPDIALQVSGYFLPGFQAVARFAVIRHGIPIMFSQVRQSATFHVSRALPLAAPVPTPHDDDNSTALPLLSIRWRPGSSDHVFRR